MKTKIPIVAMALLLTAGRAFATTFTGVSTEQFANQATTTLNGNITSGATCLTVTSAALFPTVGNFRIAVDSEYMLVTALSGGGCAAGQWTVTRGIEGSSAVSHLNGAQVLHLVTAGSEYTQSYKPYVAGVNGTGADTVSVANGNFKLTLTANETLTLQAGTFNQAPSATSLFPLDFEVCQNGTGNFTLAFAVDGTSISNLYWSGGSQPGYTSTANNGDWYKCTLDAATSAHLRCKLDMANQPC